MPSRRRQLSKAIILCLLAGKANAFDLIGECDKPEPPTCPRLGQFLDDQDFQRCKSEHEVYKDSVLFYFQCLDAKKADAKKELDRVIRVFNCHADGNIVCR